MKRMLAGAAGALALLIASEAAAQVPAAAATVTVIHAGRLLDRPGQAPRGPSTVVVRDGVIAEIRDGFVEPTQRVSWRARRRASTSRSAASGWIASSATLRSSVW